MSTNLCTHPQTLRCTACSESESYEVSNAEYTEACIYGKVRYWETWFVDRARTIFKLYVREIIKEMTHVAG
jgi:hypothetical protein